MKYLPFAALCLLSCGPVIPDIADNERPILKPCPNPETFSRNGATIKGCLDSTRLLILTNGTGARCSFYSGVINTAAKKGYLVACPNDSNTGSGRSGILALATLENLGAKMDYLLTTGHSQGGAATISIAYRAQKQYPKLQIDLLPIQPAWSMAPNFREMAPQITGQKVVVCGRLDTVVPCSGVQSGYTLLKNPKTFVTINAGHMNPQNAWASLLDTFD